MRSDRTLLKWYRKINRRFFDGECSDRVCVRWASEDEEKEVKWEERYFGWADWVGEGQKSYDGCHDWEIILSRANLTKVNHVHASMSSKLATLAHEMIHVATKNRDDHGPAFERWRVHISERGIFKKHALVKDLTIF